MDKIIWKPILKFNGEYEVSNTGLVRSTDKNILKSNGKTYFRKSKILRPAKTKDGYLQVGISFQNKLSSHKIHRLVAVSFICGQENKTDVNHKDGNKLNNFVENLEWVTKSENTKHAYENNLKKPLIGCKNGMAKLTIDQVKEIRRIADSGGRYYGRKELAKRFGISEARIKEIVTRRKNNWQDV